MPTAAVEVGDASFRENTQTIKDRHASGGPFRANTPSIRVPTRVGTLPIVIEALSPSSLTKQETNTRIYGDMSTFGVPTYPTAPKPPLSNITNSRHQANTFTTPIHKPLQKSSDRELTTVLENKPPTYGPTFVPPLRRVSSIDDTDNIVERDKAVTSCSDILSDQPCSRTSTMSSVISAKSHQEPGPIHIRPSSQLQSMQSISELDARLHAASSLRRPWRMSLPNRKIMQEDYTPTGTPESISNVPLRAGVFEAHLRLNRNVLSESTDRVNVQDWARSSEWVAPCAIDEGSKEWIADFLARQEQADRDEDIERQRSGKQDRKYGSIRNRVNSTDRFRRRLSTKRVASDRGSFEARQERKTGGIFDLDIGSYPYGRAIMPIPGEDLERPKTARAFSRKSITDQRRPQTAVSNRSSWAPTSSASHNTYGPERLHMSLPSRWSSYHPNYSFPTANLYRSPSSRQSQPTKHHYHSHGRTSSWEKLKVKAVTTIGSEVKRSISSGVVPKIAEGKDNVKSLVGKVERVGESMTRRLSASLKGKWKGLGKKKKSMNVGGIYVIGRER